MDLVFRNIDKATATPLPSAPDFAVLLACLSAAQAMTPTARIQALVDDGALAPAPARERPLVALFAEGRQPDPGATAGRFSGGVFEESER